MCVYTYIYTNDCGCADNMAGLRNQQRAQRVGTCFRWRFGVLGSRLRVGTCFRWRARGRATGEKMEMTQRRQQHSVAPDKGTPPLPLPLSPSAAAISPSRAAAALRREGEGEGRGERGALGKGKRLAAHTKGIAVKFAMATTYPSRVDWRVRKA